MSFVVLGDVAFVEQFRVKIKEVSERSDGEKMALLMLRRSNELARECIAIGRRVGWNEPKTRDWRMLLACRLIKRDTTRGALDRGVLMLTSTGLMWQQRLAHAMARISGLHFAVPGGETRFDTTLHCTCGWTASFSKNQGRVSSCESAAFAQHLALVRDGKWTKPRSVGEIVDEMMAKKEAQHVEA